MTDTKNNKNSDWIRLCEYVKKEILEYDDNMKFPKQLALKLQGIKHGQFVANNKLDKNANYDDYTILCTFMLCKKKILNYLHNNKTKIKDEQHKINIILKIIEPEINDVYIRIQNAKKMKQNLENKSFDNQTSDSGAEYTPKTKETSDRLKKLF